MGSPASSPSSWQGALAPFVRVGAPSAVRLERLSAALEQQPNNAPGWYELGCANNRAGRFEEAVQALECCHALSPRSLAVQGELAYALQGRGDLGASGALLENVIAQDPANGWAYLQLGMVRYRLNRLRDAVALWECATRCLEDPSDTLENLAMAYRRLGETDNERRCWERLRSVSVEHPAVGHMLAAHGLVPVSPRAADAYLRHLFDRFAPDFDAVLQTLQYRVPDILEERLRQMNGVPSATMKVLDLGCGTGLCGERLRPWSRHLTGVDVSAGMLKQARQRGVYDTLAEEELLSFLAAHEGDAYDWMVAGDVLCYFGRLDEIVAAVRTCLVPDGRLFLTVEADPDPECEAAAGYRLRSHGRYCHRQEYLVKVTQSSTLVLDWMDFQCLRYESGDPVRGLCAVLRKPRGGSSETAAGR